MQRRRLVTGLAALATTALAGCSGSGGGDGSGSDGSGSSDGGSGPTTVEMANTAFDPVQASVDVGGTVEWVNEDDFQHDVTAAQFSDGAAAWDFQETLSNGQSTTHTFDSEGAYEYYCTVHGESSMCGVVVVGGVSYDGSLPCQDDGGGGGY